MSQLLCANINHKIRVIETVSNGKNKIYRRCIDCASIREKQWRLDNKEKNRIGREKTYKKIVEHINNNGRAESRKCALCKLTKDASNFYIENHNRYGLHRLCIPCAKMDANWRTARLADRNKGNLCCTREEYISVVSLGRCSYCLFKGHVGADRIDNTKGHELSNIVPCCTICNQVRNTVFTVEEMKFEIGPIIAKIRSKRKLIFLPHRYK